MSLRGREIRGGGLLRLVLFDSTVQQAFIMEAPEGARAGGVIDIQAPEASPYFRGLDRRVKTYIQCHCSSHVDDPVQVYR